MSRWLSALALAVALYSLTAAELDTPPSAPVPPFLNLRQATLAYHGPDEVLPALTEYRLGWFGPTNLSDPLTGDLWWAANLAVREANTLASHASPHGSRAFRLIPRWAVDPWGTGVSQLTRMVYEEQPIALIGSIDSATTHLAEQVVAKANLPLVSPIATDQTVTLAGVPWVFACAPSDTTIARVLVDDILTFLASEIPNPQSPIPNPKSDALALLACTDHESRMTAREILRELSRRGRLPDRRFDIPSGAANLAQPMHALQDVRPAAVLILAGAEDSARLVRAVRERLPFHPPIPADIGQGEGRADHRPEEGGANPAPPRATCALFGGPSTGHARFRELAGPAAEGLRFPFLSGAALDNPRYAAFANSFAGERGRAPDDTALLTYDATCLLLEAVRQAGPSRARVRTALASLSPWRGVTGTITFDGTGQNTSTNVRMATLRGGRIERGSAPLEPAPCQSRILEEMRRANLKRTTFHGERNDTTLPHP